MSGQSTDPALRAWAEEGLATSRRIEHPVARRRHVYAWAHRWIGVDAGASLAIATELELAPGEARALLKELVRSEVRERGSPKPYLDRLLALPECPCPSEELALVNEVSELLLEAGDASLQEALEQLRPLWERVERLAERDPEGGGLAHALVAETAVLLGATERGAYLERAIERLGSALHPDPLRAFLAGVASREDPDLAARLAEEIQNPSQRLEARLELRDRASGEMTGEALRAILADAELVEQQGGPEILVRVAQSLLEAAPAEAERLLEKAWKAGDEFPPQLRALHWTGIAAVTAGLDREAAEKRFAAAVAAAGEEADRTRRLPVLVLIANEMAEAFPRAAGELLEALVSEAAAIDTNWELVHLLELMLRPDRSPYLDTSPAAALVRLLAARIQDDEPRIPGVMGLPELAQWAMIADRGLGFDLWERAYRAARTTGDTGSRCQAACAVWAEEPATAETWLEETLQALQRRVDCPAMGEFARSAGPLAPALVEGLAEWIPDRRERADARVAAAVGYASRDPDRARTIVSSLAEPAEQSLACLRIFDTLAGTSQAPYPEPLLEDLP